MKPIWSIFACIALILGCSNENSDPTPSPQFDLSVASASTLRVVTVDADGGISSGSGVAVAPNFVLTNFHVIEGAQASYSPQIYIWDNSAGFPRPVSALVEYDPRLDLALLYVRGATSTPVTFALNSPRQLEAVTALGFPAASDMIFGRLRDTVSATSGQVTATDHGPIGSFGEAELILHTATVNPGNSGGPLFNSCGEVVGVNTLRADPQEVSNAFVASTAMEIVAFLESNGISPQVAQAVCSATNNTRTECSYDRGALDQAIAAKSIGLLDRQIATIPQNCATLLQEAWTARRDISRELVQAFLRISGTWRLQDQECNDRTWLRLSGLAIFGAANERIEVERLESLSTDGSIVTRTIHPAQSAEPNFSYRLAGEQLAVHNLVSDTSWEMTRCTG